ncbi:class I SAM-dependent methyltransferase [Pseudomarimonas salicorniae]|uniref:site-specific DNA-methyltransferase (adenine-specific) n=1 Tax=Pseudomarimonas salicorniae TaxID=2933270 RepID=A0ABT0GG42_9GAMM|nr:class I SAM-dependent methyltransferase [Lysobacter sp. CAU 1642]MCK7593514.1 class I SAM-dependent methyltransferase [Lysobacter sp. CAU 1642]
MKQQPSDNKLRGGYYTPPAISKFLAAWAISEDTRSVLEPSCGDGNILVEVLSRASALDAPANVTAIELSESEAKKALRRAKDLGTNVAHVVRGGSFFDHAEKMLDRGSAFDAVVGNPPFIRYQDFPEDQRQQAFALMRRLSLNPSRLANAWLPFVALCTGLLTDRGRLAMVVPAELFQVGYASEVRQFLADSFDRISIVAFKKLVFPEIQQEIVLVLAERGAGKSRGVRVHEVEDASELGSMDLLALAKKATKPIDHASEKWTKYFLSKSEILLLRDLRERPDIPIMSKFIDVDVGVVTGNNDYFMLSKEEVADHGLSSSCIPLVGRSAALQGTLFEESDFQAWVKSGRKAYMFAPAAPHHRNVQRYVRHGQALGVNAGYKCRIRREWYVVPAVWRPDVFFLRQADSSPRMVANETTAICTDTLHRGRLVDGYNARSLSTAFVNSLTFAASEVTGRSYGGGVMTFEPSEMERLPLPVSGVDQLDPLEIDRLIREKKVDVALDMVDSITLIDGLGLTTKQVQALRGIWQKLRDRRRGRKN